MKRVWKISLIAFLFVLGIAFYFCYQLFFKNPVPGPPIAGRIEHYTYKRERLFDFGINQNIELKIFLPPDYTTARQYAIVFLLDGDDLFTGTAGYLSKMASEKIVPDAILVGIGYGYLNGYLANPKEGRWRDYSFPEDPEFSATANGPKFYEFLSKILVPEMKRRYHGLPHKSALIGHSMGGDFTYYAFLQYDPTLGEKNPFTCFIIGDGGNEQHFANVYMPHFASVMAGNQNKTHTKLMLYRVWGYKTNAEAIKGQEDFHQWVVEKKYQTIDAFRYYPLNDDHAATMKTTIVNGLKLALGNKTFMDYSDPSGFHFSVK